MTYLTETLLIKSGHGNSLSSISLISSTTFTQQGWLIYFLFSTSHQLSHPFLPSPLYTSSHHSFSLGFPLFSSVPFILSPDYFSQSHSCSLKHLSCHLSLRVSVRVPAVGGRVCKWVVIAVHSDSELLILDCRVLQAAGWTHTDWQLYCTLSKPSFASCCSDCLDGFFREFTWF